MRCAAGLGLSALVGCNQVLGLGATRELDAAPPDIPHVVLDYQVAASDGSIGYQVIQPAPHVRIAPLDAAFTDAGYTDQGWVEIPRDYLMTTWRLEYTLADGLPREVQWAPADKRGHVTLPRFGAVDRPPVPAGGGYAIAPAGAPGLTAPRVFTTGLWSEGIVPGFAAGATQVDYDFTSAVTMSGPPGQLGAGDQAWLIDFKIDAATGCRFAAGGAQLADPRLASPHAPSSPTWEKSTISVGGVSLGADLLGRLRNSLDNLEEAFSAPLSLQLFGSLANPQMPALTVAPRDATPLGVALATPVMVSWMQCPYNVPKPPMPAPPHGLLALTSVVHAQLVDTRMALGVSLASGLETVGLITLPPEFAAPLATKIHLVAAPGVPALDADLSGLVDQVAIGAPRGQLVLSFAPETEPPTLHADYYQVTLHKIVGGGLTAVRSYTAMTPAVRIDAGVLVPGVDYVFEIRSVAGQPGVVTGDFAPAALPYSAAVVFTRTFRAS